MKKNTQGLSIVIGTLLVVFISILAIFILEYIIPYSKSVKGIENSSVSYYNANSAIEDSLLFINQNGLGDEDSKDTSDYKYNITASGGTLPPAGKGNSEYHPDYNIIKRGVPVIIDVKDSSFNWAGLDLTLQVPEIKNGTTETLSGGSIPIIYWQLSSKNTTLNASGSWITANDINGNSPIIFQNKKGKINNGDPDNIGNYSSNNCTIADGGCKLKLQIVNNLEIQNGPKLPYIEWKIDYSDKLPLNYIEVNTSGNSRGFRKDISIRVPIEKSNEGFDFTIFR